MKCFLAKFIIINLTDCPHQMTLRDTFRIVSYDSHKSYNMANYIRLIKNYCSVAATRTLFQEEFIQDPELFRCPESHTFLSVINVVYVGATNILLLNLLIAMFTYSFDRVQKNTAGDMDRWNTLKYSLIKEYHHKSPIIAPFRKVLKLIYLTVIVLQYSLL